MNTAPSPPFTDVPERIAQVIFVLCQTVTMRFSLRVRTLTKEQVEYICGRLLAARKRFRRVVERIRAGRPPIVRARKPRPSRARPKLKPMSDAELNRGFPPPKGWKRWAREDRARERAARAWAAQIAAADDKKPVPPWRALRLHLFGWLCGCAPAIAEFPQSAAACAHELRALLADPEMQALLMRSRSVGDSLRGVCWGLGVERSLLYPHPPVVAPAMAAPDPLAPTPAETVFAAPPAEATGAPEDHGPRAVAAPSPPRLSGNATSSPRACGALDDGEFFAPG